MSCDRCANCGRFVDTDYEPNFYLELTKKDCLPICEGCQSELPDWFTELLEQNVERGYVTY